MEGQDDEKPSYETLERIAYIASYITFTDYSYACTFYLHVYSIHLHNNYNKLICICIMPMHLWPSIPETKV